MTPVPHHVILDLISEKNPDWGVAAASSASKITLTCPNGHPKHTRLHALKNIKRPIECPLCAINSARELVNETLPTWRFRAYFSQSLVRVICPKTHDVEITIKALRSNTAICPYCVALDVAQLTTNAELVRHMRSRNAVIRMAVASNPHCSNKTLLRLATDSDDNVRSAVVDNPASPPSVAAIAALQA